MYCKSRSGWMGMIFAGLLGCTGLASGAGVTIYVDASNTGGPWDGSAANPWSTIHDGADHLATLTGGGHILLVAAGSYSAPGDLVLNAGHSGTVAATNVLRGVGQVATGRIWFNGVTHFHLDNFTVGGGIPSPRMRLYGGTSDVIIENCIVENVNGWTAVMLEISNGSGNNCIIRGSEIAGGRKANIDHDGRANQHVTVEESAILQARCTGIRIRSTGGLTLKNTIVAGNARFGLHIASGAQLDAGNSIFYANGLDANAYFAGTGKTYEDAADFAELAAQSNIETADIMVSNPGFAGLSDGRNLNLFYENSPVLKANTGFARDIGPHQDPPTVPVLSNTYYVDAESGNDSRTPFEALNENTPWETIARAAEYAAAGDTVIVKPGIYPAGNVTIKHGGSGDLPVIYRADGDVTIEIAAAGAALRLDNVGGVVMEGFKISGTAGGYLTSLVRVISCFGIIFRDCDIYETGTQRALRIDGGGSRIILRDSMIRSGNIAIHGDANKEYSILLERCRVYDSNLGIQQLWPGSRIVNSIFHNNTAHVTVELSDDLNSVRIENCVFKGATGIGIDCGPSTVNLINTILAENPGDAVRTSDSNNSIVNASHNCFYDNGVNFRERDTTERQTEEDLNALENWNDNIVADPLFADAAFRLAPESPCIDAGTPTTELETDFFGNPRRTGVAVDIGLYEVPPRPSMIIIR